MKTTLEIMKALSDRNRLRVAAALMEQKELCACQIVELLQVAGATASRHMDLLIRAGLVESRKDGRWVYYRLGNGFPPPLFQWLEDLLRNDPDIQTDRKTLIKITGCKP
ncbi:MAG: winged helix-turn-helix transcriptional regulator [Pontiellaceae bacterium]|nr:winged helix-turn-helix transcriptional regulator [Pontiellaceae bacterium]